MALAAPGAATAQVAAPLAPAGQPSSAPPPPPERENPGLINEIGKLLKKPSALLPTFGRPEAEPSEHAEPMPPPAALQQPAAPSPSAAAIPQQRQPTPHPMVPTMVTGHQNCPDSPNGGANCEAAAEMLCKAKGYGAGKSLTVDSTETCSAKVLIPGRPRQPGDCRNENFVTRAWCQ